LRKLMVAALVVLLAVGASYAYDTKIIDVGTDLNNLHQTIRPISHVLSGDYQGRKYAGSKTEGYGTGYRYGPRSIGEGWTVSDDAPYSIFFGAGHRVRVGVMDAAGPGDNYFDHKQNRLGMTGGVGLDLQQAESTAVWRGIPMMTGSLMKICGTPEGCVGQGWSARVETGGVGIGINPGQVAELINPWPLTNRSGGYGDPSDGTASIVKPYGNYDRTPAASSVDSPDFFGYAVPRIEARNISHALFANPGTNVGTDEDPFTIGQETMTSVFVWSADINYITSPDMSGIGGSTDTVAVMVRLDNDLYKGLKVKDLNVVKVESKSGSWQGQLLRVNSASQLRKNTFAVVLRDGENIDRVLQDEEVIGACTRKEALLCGDCDLEWLNMQYFALIAVQKNDPWDVGDATLSNVVGGLHIIVGERPFVKTPNLCCGYPVGVEPRFGWVLGNRPNAEQRCDGFTRDPFLADAISGRPENMGLASGYPAAVVGAMENWNQMYFVKDEVVDAYGFAGAPVFKLPAVRAGSVPAEKTALVMYTIRLGDGEMELPVADFVGKTPAEVRLIDVGGSTAGDMQEYTRADVYTDLTEGHFAILKPHATNRHEQVIVPADEAFTNGVYFVALAARDNGDWDHDKFNPLSNNQVWFSPAFMVLGGAQVPSLVIGPAQSKIEPGEELQLTATNSITGDEVDVTWESDDEAVLTVSDTGLVTGVADGTATVTATPVAPSDLDPATKNITVETPQPGGGGSGGGCSVGFAPAAVLLLAPLFVLLKK